MNILVTGGAGYIGSHMIYCLLDKGYNVLCIDNLSTGNKKYLPVNINLKTFNIGSGHEVTEFMIKEMVTSVIHFAADVIVSESVSNPIKYYTNNTLNALNLFKSCRDAGIKYHFFIYRRCVWLQ